MERSILEIKVLKSYKKLSSTVANIVKRQLKKHPLSKLGLPTGDTPLGMYDELVKRELDWSHVITFNLDVYLMNVDHPESYQSYMRKNLFEKLFPGIQNITFISNILHSIF